MLFGVYSVHRSRPRPFGFGTLAGRGAYFASILAHSDTHTTGGEPGEGAGVRPLAGAASPAQPRAPLPLSPHVTVREERAGRAHPQPLLFAGLVERTARGEARGRRDGAPLKVCDKRGPVRGGRRGNGGPA